MSERDESREWLCQEAQRYPDGWEANLVKRWGLEGALDLLSVYGGDVLNVNLSHSPFRQDQELKRLVWEARAAVREAVDPARLRAAQLVWEAL